eukprot:scaffold2707_cov417-Prasinococcus_capsulatus_cf.AAC.4
MQDASLPMRLAVWAAAVLSVLGTTSHLHSPAVRETARLQEPLQEWRNESSARCPIDTRAPLATGELARQT